MKHLTKRVTALILALMLCLSVLSVGVLASEEMPEASPQPETEAPETVTDEASEEIETISDEAAQSAEPVESENMTGQTAEGENNAPAAHIDEDILESTVYEGQKILEHTELYVEEGIDELRAAVQTGQAVLEKEYPAYGEVDAAITAIWNAIDGVQRIPGSPATDEERVELHGCIENWQAELTRTDLYTGEGFDRLEAAIAAAQAALEKDDLTYAEYDTVRQNGWDAYTELERLPDSPATDREISELEYVVREGQSILDSEGLYTGKGMDQFRAVVQAGQAVLEKESPTHEEVDAAQRAIEQAKYTMLERIPDSPATDDERGNLYYNIKDWQAALTRTDLYTGKGFDRLEAAIAAVQAALEKDDLTYAEYDTVQQNGRRAYGELERRPDSPATDNDRGNLQDNIENWQAALTHADLYTGVGVDRLEAAIAAARAALEKDDLTYAEYNAVTQNGWNAYIWLERRPDSPALEGELSWLNSSIGYGQDVLNSEGMYESFNLDKLEAAVKAAQAAMEKEGLTYAECQAADEAIMNLALIRVPGSPALAEELESLAMDIDVFEEQLEQPEKYDMDNAGELRQAIAEARALLAKENVTYAEYQAAESAIRLAALDRIPASAADETDFRLLEMIIEEAQKTLRQSDLYLTDNFDALRDAVAAAQAVLAKENATYAEVEAVIDAINAIVIKRIPDSSVTESEMSELTYAAEYALWYAETKALGNAELKAAVAAAEKLLEQDKITYAEYEKALNAIQDIMDVLEPDNTQSGGNTKPQPSDTPESTPGGAARPGNAPRTGDETTVTPYIALLIVCAAALWGVTALRKKEN